MAAVPTACLRPTASTADSRPTASPVVVFSLASGLVSARRGLRLRPTTPPVIALTVAAYAAVASSLALPSLHTITTNIRLAVPKRALLPFLARPRGISRNSATFQDAYIGKREDRGFTPTQRQR
jgi:hypothetical protein